ncbi:MAG: hypothetical protein ABSD27_11400 [Bryobacteraceae bacterium]|jgi:hypothetical protein
MFSALSNPKLRNAYRKADGTLNNITGFGAARDSRILQIMMIRLQAIAFGIFNALSNGTLLYWDALTTPKTIQQDDSGRFAPGALVVKED